MMVLASSLLLIAAACGTAEQQPRGELTALEPGIAARVADEAVSVELVASIARDQHVTAAVARDRAVGDALFAAHARERFAGTGLIETAERGALARALLESLRDEAQKAGPPTDAEVQSVTELRWMDLDRPSMARTLHAVIRVKKPEDRARAADLAQELRRQLDGVREPEEFERRAKAFDAKGLELVVETLAPVAEDGRIAAPNPPPGSEPQRFDAAFARAANALAAAGDQSPVVESAFGFHVILLLEKLPPARFPLETRRNIVSREVLQRRASELQSKLLAELAKARPIVEDRAAQSLVSEVQISR